MAIITLLTDFGIQDEYVGVLKGVMLTINPTLTIMDISHHIPPQGIERAGEMLSDAFSWFPQGTIHVAVVDPGVGSERAVIAMRHAGHYFLAPDNGLLSPLLNASDPEEIVAVQNGAYCLHPVSATFHGRDIFAPVAAHLSRGLALSALGPALSPSKLVRLAAPGVVWDSAQQITGQIIGIDHFGNFLTNIDSSTIRLLEKQNAGCVLRIQIGKRWIEGLVSTYADAASQTLIALIGSHGRLEIAVTHGSAAAMLQVQTGQKLRVTAEF